MSELQVTWEREKKLERIVLRALSTVSGLVMPAEWGRGKLTEPRAGRIPS